MHTAQNVCTCTQCRVSSPLCSAFQRIGRGKNEEAQRQSQMRLISFAFLLVLGSSVAALGKTTNPGWLLINLALVTFMAWLTILPHEAGHAFVAKLVGLGVDRIVLGIGRKLGTFMFFKVPIEIHLYPAGGLTLLEVRDLPHFRWKLATVTLAGPMVDILLLWAAITWGETAWRAERIDGGFAPVCALIAALFLGIVFNLWPMRVGTSAGRTANDGALLLSLALRKPFDLKSAERSQDLARLNDLFEKRQWREVVQHADHYLRELPDDYAIQVTLSAALINLGDFDRSRAVLEQLIDRAPANEWQRAVVANNLAWLYLLLEDGSLSARSLTLSATAYALLPWEPFITSTYAATQALFGDAEQAIRLFNTSRIRQGHVSTLASTFAGLAIAHARLGRAEDAMAALRRAHEIDPETQLVGIAQRRLGRGR
jgi:Flp pilus assembly protein TadD